ncbi:MAG: hypothetical protein SGJ18_01910 [Pseudomonadota bacterium]|nr:hypothetical protein [Pseudomonadota bacterium]
MKYQTLLTVIDYSGKEAVWLKKFIWKTKMISTIERISSIYQDSYESEGSASTEKPLVVCALLQADFSQYQFIDKIISIESEINIEATHEVIRAIVLAQEDYIVMTPKLVLPHPRLFTHPQLLFPAAEVWPEYRHPVLNKSLVELTKVFEGSRWGSYFAQGSTLLDFSQGKK